MDRTREAASKADEKYRASQLLKSALSIGLFALCGFLAGRAELPFGAYPFGVALLCALNREALYLFAGLCVAVISS